MEGRGRMKITPLGDGGTLNDAAFKIHQILDELGVRLALIASKTGGDPDTLVVFHHDDETAERFQAFTVEETPRTLLLEHQEELKLNRILHVGPYGDHFSRPDGETICRCFEPCCHKGDLCICPDCTGKYHEHGPR